MQAETIVKIYEVWNIYFSILYSTKKMTRFDV